MFSNLLTDLFKKIEGQGILSTEQASNMNKPIAGPVNVCDPNDPNYLECVQRNYGGGEGQGPSIDYESFAAKPSSGFGFNLGDMVSNINEGIASFQGISQQPSAFNPLGLGPATRTGGLFGPAGLLAGFAIDKYRAGQEAKAAEEAKAEAERQARQREINKNKQYFSGPSSYSGGTGDLSGGRSSSSGEAGYGGFCFDPNTPVQMADGSEKKIKDIQLGDETKGGEVTGVFQFKAADEIHNYKGVTVAGSHFVKEDGKFIMVKDSPIAVKIEKIPVVYSLDTSGRRIFIKDIEFADYNGDGIAKNFLNNAGIDLSGFDKEVLRQVENRIL